MASQNKKDLSGRFGERGTQDMFSDPHDGKTAFTLFLRHDVDTEEQLAGFRAMIRTRAPVLYMCDLDDLEPVFMSFSRESLANAEKMIAQGNFSRLRLVNVIRYDVVRLESVEREYIPRGALSEMAIGNMTADQRVTLLSIRDVPGMPADLNMRRNIIH